ncbi:class I SAM-dependent methyltransferase [Nocardia uniformis]|uniref:Class I SAM-dependent methyltransferase n=1 Tax=Nocardia uniformis TaxID=53432 RepID=A0A849BP87_9NOCA|nr:class I SAM-dependent methyltransferase [Nocardia uniformis]NNH68393.1 class I SAM-dependent methyltransferase [Nocardia uniformis]
MDSDLGLQGIPLTMLWTLHNRASEAKRADGVLSDPECVRIYDSIDFDYLGMFGAPDGTHAVRSARFDSALRQWRAGHPGGVVVELGAGLETQFQRCDDGAVRWLCIDVPEAIDLRERFLPSSQRCRYLPMSALDPAWLDEVDSAEGVFVSAQGLFMYFDADEVREICTAIFDRFADVELMFDTIPPWFSRKTLRGFHRTRNYTAPPMPWGIKRSQVPTTLRAWNPRAMAVSVRSYGPSRGPLAASLPVFERFPLLRDLPPAIARARSTL